MDFNVFKEYEPIYVIGHKNPDVDSVISTVLLSNIFNKNGILAYPSFLSKNYEIDNYNKNILDDCISLNMTIIDEEENNYNYVLVDHNDPTQSIGFGKKIIWGIDHHNNSNILSNIVLSKLCSCSLAIYNYFKDKYEFSNEEKFMIYMASLSDSLFLKGSRFTKEDKEKIKELGYDLDVDSLFHKYFIPTDLSNGLDNILDKSTKDYNYRGVKFSSVVIKTYNEYEYLKQDFINIINNKNNFLGVWIDFDREITFAYFNYNGRVKEFMYDFIASRAATIIPDIFSCIDFELEEII